MNTVGLVYDDRYLLHDSPRHPENKQRLELILSYLKDRNVLDRLENLTPRLADISEIEYVHAPEYIESIQHHSSQGYSALDADTYVNSHSFSAARLAAGGSIAAVDSVIDREVDAALCLVRPPGHHAEPDRAMGFCLFNNIAIAARHAIRVHGLERILILDWDVHHGNGTQAAFYNDPRVLYFSVHQHFIFPGTGAVVERGAGEGEGYTINVPFPGGCADADYELALREILIPLCDRYRPQLVLISAGQDAHEDDPLAGMGLTSSAYGAMTEIAREIALSHADGRVAAMLEGGYSRKGAPEAVFYILDALADLGAERPERSHMSSVRPEVRDILRAVRKQTL